MQSSPHNSHPPVLALDEPTYDPAEPHSETAFHWILLTVSSVVVLLAVLLQVRGEEQVVLRESAFRCLARVRSSNLSERTARAAD